MLGTLMAVLWKIDTSWKVACTDADELRANLRKSVDLQITRLLYTIYIDSVVSYNRKISIEIKNSR